jgi:hypothetical protein
MKSYDWSSLDEAGRYEVWSLHIEAGVEYIGYVLFCDLMDDITARHRLM